MIFMDCIFCKIINREIPAEIVYEDGNVLAFCDINPKADTHLLIIPKIHIESIKSNGSEDVMPDLIKVAKIIVQEKGLESFKLAFNVGRGAGQMVDHLHMHFLSGGLKNLADLIQKV